MQKRLNSQKLNHQFEGYKLSYASIIDTDHALYELIPDANTLQNNNNHKNEQFAQQPLSFQMKKHLSMHNHLHICPKFHINNDQEEEEEEVMMMSLLFVINELHHVHVYLVNRTFAFMEEPLFIFGEITVENDELNNGCTMMCNHKSIHLEQFQNQQTKHWISVLLCSDGYGSLFMNHVNATIATVVDVAQQKMSCELMSEWNELQHMFDYVRNERQYEGDYSLFLRHYLPSKIVCAQMLSVTDDEGELIVVLESSLDFCVYRDVKEVKPKKRIEFFVSIVKFKFRLCSAEKDDEAERIECLEFKSVDTVYMPSSGLKTGFFRSTNNNQLILVSSSTIRSVKETQQQESMVIDEEEEQVDLEIDVREQVDTNIRGQQTNSSSRFIDHFTSTMDNEDDNTNEGSLSEECHIYELNTRSISLNCLYSNAFQLVVDSIGPSNKYIAVAHDVDVCVYEFDESQNEFCHQYTLHALQYILNGKPNRLFMVYSDQIAAITEQKRVFLYDHQSTDNRTHLAKHQILQLEDDELLLGIRICAGCVFILTQDNIACYSINNSNNNHHN